MPLVKTCNFFHYLFAPKIRLEIAFNDILDRKGSLLTIKTKFSKSQKSHFSKWVNQCFWSKNPVFFQFLFSVKIRLEIRFNNVLDRKKTLFGNKDKIFPSPQNSIFPKGLTHASA